MTDRAESLILLSMLSDIPAPVDVLVEDMKRFTANEGFDIARTKRLAGYIRDELNVRGLRMCGENLHIHLSTPEDKRRAEKICNEAVASGEMAVV